MGMMGYFSIACFYVGWLAIFLFVYHIYSADRKYVPESILYAALPLLYYLSSGIVESHYGRMVILVGNSFLLFFYLLGFLYIKRFRRR